jgi:two-component system phosphate regulon sensor histidine kinase PhoR
MDGSFRVIVIDDEEGMREGMRRVLERKGYAVDLAEDGESAITRLKQARYDLALVDLKMPGIDGFEVTRYINETIGNHTVVVIVSALATVEAAVEVTQHGAFDFLVKPFTPQDLMQVVERAARQRTLIRERETYLTEINSERTLSRQLINSMHEGVIVLNIARKPVLMNPKAELFLSVPYSTELSVEQLGLGEGSIKAVDEMLALAPGTDAVRVLREPVGERMLEIIITPYFLGEQNAGALVIIEDYTDEWKIEQDKIRFISMVAHELKSPLAAILNYINIILTGMFDTQVEKIHEMLARSKIRGEALLDLIRDLLFLNQRAAGKVEKSLERLDLREVLKAQLEFFTVQADRTRIQLTLQAPEEPAWVFADRQDLDRIFMNLISNGIKYNREDGSLTVALSLKEREVWAEVRDTGIGMSPAEMEGLFQEFYRVKNSQTGGIPGTGLGLATVKRMVEECNGRIKVDSTPGEGSSFTVVLPRASD